jgi:hypothetical protein
MENGREEAAGCSPLEANRLVVEMVGKVQAGFIWCIMPANTWAVDVCHVRDRTYMSLSLVHSG